MQKLLLLPVLFLLALTASAQNRATIKGKITDSLSKEPVEYVTIAVLNANDTTAASMITYAQTNKEGTFSIGSLPVNVSLKVVISFVSYKPYVRFFKLIKGQTMDMGNVKLSPRQLNEVVITGERMPITVSKDTIEFDAAAFKTRPNAVVEDLLKKLPGVEIDNSGKITVLGKDVTKIMIDGKEFFANDPRIASKNLDADLIAKVQVYDDRENDPNHLIPDNEVNKIINLKFKKALKKSVFGKMYAGGGTQDHYQSGGLFNMFRDTLQVSALGYTNNLNSTGFDFNDLYTNGGANRGGEGFSGLAFGGFGGSNGKQTATSTGVNINTDYGKKLKINFNYVFKHTNTSYNSLSNRQQFIGDTTVTTGSISDRFNKADSHGFTSAVNWRPNDTTQIRYNPSFTINNNGSGSNSSSNSFNSAIGKVNNSFGDNASNSNSIYFRHSFNYSHNLKKKGSTISADHSFSFNPGNNGLNFDNSNLVSFVPAVPSYALKRRSESANRSTNGSANVNYRTMLSKKLYFDVTANTDYSNQLDKASTYDYNPVTGEYDSFLLTLSSDLNRISWKESVNPGLTYNIPKSQVSFIVHFNTQWQQVRNIFQRNVADINQQFFYVLPVVNLRIKSFSIGYNRNVQLPNIGDMIPYSIVYSPLYSVTGNPNLKPTVSDRVNISYNKYNYQKGDNYSFSANFSSDQNSVFRQRTVSSELAETSMPINRNGRYSAYMYGYISKQLKKTKTFKLLASTNVNISHNHDFFVINRQDGYQNSFRTSLSERFTLSWDGKLEFSPQYSISNNRTTYSGVAYNNQNVTTHNGDARFMIYFPKKFNLEGNYTYRYNPQVAPGYQKSSNLLNLNLAHQFLSKDRGEIKLSCYDLLDQNISTSRFVNENSIYDNQSQIIKRYFMLTLQFRFNKSTVKGDDKAAPKIGPVMRTIIMN